METHDLTAEILVLASSLKIGRAFIQRIKNLSRKGGQVDQSKGRTLETDGRVQSYVPDAGIDTVAYSDEAGPLFVPWTILNRYYSAEVHFAVETFQRIQSLRYTTAGGSQEESQAGYEKVPAVIWVWTVGEPYEQYAQTVLEWLEWSGCEPEVSLAVQVLEDVDSIHSGREDDESIDSVLIGLGFEYVNATGQPGTSASGTEGDKVEASNNVPRLPRVVDALSTIMWPSMSRSKGCTASNVEESLGELVARDPAGILMELEAILHLPEIQDSDALSPQPNVNFVSFDWNVSNVQASASVDPWGSEVTSGSQLKALSESDASLFSPFGLAAGTKLHRDLDRQDALGFDDDFSGLVSASAASSSQCHSSDRLPAFGVDKAPDERTSTFSEPAAALLPPNDGVNETLRAMMFNGDGLRYQITGSPGTAAGKSGKGLQIPVGRGIGQAQYCLSNSSDGVLEHSHPPMSVTASDRGGGPTHGEQKINPDPPLSGEDEKARDDDTDEDDMGDLTSFDLTRVLGALRQLKEEIRGIEDEDVRRMAAAKAAMGVVYGLEGDDDVDWGTIAGQ